MGTLKILDSQSFKANYPVEFNVFETLGRKIGSKISAENLGAILFLQALILVPLFIASAASGEVLPLPISVVGAIIFACLGFIGLTDMCSYRYAIYRKRGQKIDKFIQTRKQKKLLRTSSTPLIGTGAKDLQAGTYHIEYSEEILNCKEPNITFNIQANVYKYNSKTGWQNYKLIKQNFVCDTSVENWMDEAADIKHLFKSKVEGPLKINSTSNDNKEVLLQILSKV